MLPSCLRVSSVAAVLLIASLATRAPATPSFSVTWQVVLETGFSAALVSQGVVFQVNQTPGVSYGYTDTLIATTANQSLWTLQSTGPLISNIAVYAFSAIPKLVFVLFNNMQQPNISAVIPFTGTVVWSTLCPFDVSYLPPTLTVSPDGSALYWSTSNDNSTNGLIALDAEYGTVLWSEIIHGYNFPTPLQCGPPHSNCMGVFNDSSPVIVFLDGRTRALLSEVTLPGDKAQASVIIGLGQATLDVVLVLGDYEFVAINTTSFTVLSSWSVPEPGVPPYTLLQPMVPGSPTTLAVIEMSNQGAIYAVDLFTGSYLWTTDGLHHGTSDLLGCANSIPMLQQVPLTGPGDLFVVEANCVVSLVNLTTGALVKSVNINYSPNVLIPIGSESFIVGNSFYDTNLTLFAVYPPANSPCQASAVVVEGNTAMFTLWCPYEGGQPSVVAGVVSG